MQPNLPLQFREYSNCVHSNLTFGAGGKDKDGKNVVGWGYYEVSSQNHDLHFHDLI